MSDEYGMFGNCALKKTSLRITTMHLLRARRLSAVQQITISKCSCYVVGGFFSYVYLLGLGSLLVGYYWFCWLRG